MKMHLNLAARDLDASVAYYRTLLAAEPVKHYDDYALFLTDDPWLELAIDVDLTTQVREGAHYGVVVEKPEDVDAAIARLRAASHAVDVEMDETCCYAVQNKCGRPIPTADVGRRISSSPKPKNATTKIRRTAERKPSKQTESPICC